MSSRQSWVVTVMVIVALLAGAYPLQRYLGRERHTEKLGEGELVQASNLGAATILLLGGFRGLAVDVLWLRSINLHETRQYHEERALLDLISKLQPHYASVWVFQSWNIAFNISVQYQSAEEQFKWIQEGRDFLLKGRRMLPESAEVAFYMGALYLFKYPQNPRFQELLEQTDGINNYEEAAVWFDRSRRLIWERKSMLSVFSPRIADSGVFNCYRERYKQILEQGTVAPEGYSRETLERAEPWRLKAQEEARGLNERWPNDAAFVQFAGQLALVPVDGYMFHARKAMIAGGGNVEGERQARDCLNMARETLAAVVRQHPDLDNGPLVRNRLDQIPTLIPSLYIRAAMPVVAGQAQPPRELVLEARKWLDRARVILSQSEYQSDQVKSMRQQVQVMLDRIEQILKTSPPESVPSEST